MFIELNYRSRKAPYLQIVDQVKYAAAGGIVRPGESLPGIRPLAQQLKVNRNTVAKAYAELEREGVVENHPGKGCFLSNNNSPFKKSIRTKMLAEAIDAAVVQAHHLQVGEDEFLELIKERLGEFTNRKNKPTPNS